MNPIQWAHTEVPTRLHRALLRPDVLFVEVMWLCTCQLEMQIDLQPTVAHNLQFTSSSSISFAFCPHRMLQSWLSAFPCLHLPGFWFSRAHRSQGNRAHELTVLFCFGLWRRWAFGFVSSLLLPIPPRPYPAARQHLWRHSRARFCVDELREEHCGLKNFLRIATYKQKSGLLLVSQALDKTLFSKHCVSYRLMPS